MKIRKAYHRFSDPAQIDTFVAALIMLHLLSLHPILRDYDLLVR